MDDSLDSLINDIDDLLDSDYVSEFLKNEIDDLMSKIFEIIGVATITDTNQAKSLICSIVSFWFDRDIRHIMDVEETFYWGNDRGKWKGEIPQGDKIRNYGVTFDVDIEDDGLVGQEEALEHGRPRYPSPKPYNPITGEKRDNSEYYPKHITKILEQVNEGEIEEVEILLYRIIDKIEDKLGGLIG